MQLEGAQLLPILDNMAAQPNAWFEKQLKEHCKTSVDEGDYVHEIDGNPDDEGAPLATEDLPVEFVADDQLLVPIVQQTALARVLVNRGPGTLSLKVYFDNFSGGGGTRRHPKQRGFVHGCAAHGCIKYMAVSSHSQAEFCAYMYLWWLAAGVCTSKKAHLEWEPPSTDVEICARDIHMTPF